MKRTVLIHLGILSLAVFFSFIWVNNEFTAPYSLQLTAVLLLIFLFTRRKLPYAYFRVVESAASAIAILLITSTTGGVHSPFFFLNDFLLFELSLLLEPVIPLYLSGLLILFYLFSHIYGITAYPLAPLLSLPLMTPLAYFMGQIYQKVKNQKQEIQGLTKKIEKLEEELVEEEINKNQESGTMNQEK